uniref:Uncharacterized protein n=1 Tax=Nelumbo nucifera TaxID=4432 RepID=A0A822Z1F5_NELNU|nr:TPA_asm: hypothetical protein HUJ06_008152 [Nelumbo nucifera]
MASSAMERGRRRIRISATKPATHGIMASSAMERGRQRGGISATKPTTPATHGVNKPFLFFFSSPLQTKLLFTRSLGSGSAPPPSSAYYMQKLVDD